MTDSEKSHFKPAPKGFHKLPKNYGFGGVTKGVPSGEAAGTRGSVQRGKKRQVRGKNRGL